MCFPVGKIVGKPDDTVGFENSWMQSRTFGGDRGHEGCDIMASENVRGIYPVYSMTDGVVENIGWLRLGGSWYWLGSSGAMAPGWQKVAGEWYYLDADGAMVTGWEKVSGLWYHFSGSGQMSTGWLDLDGSWYYLGTDGAMVMGTEWIDGVEYQFGPTGALLGA